MKFGGVSMEIVQRKLSNEAELLAVCTKVQMMRYHARFVFNSGSFDEDTDTRGISHLLEHLMFNGDPKMNSMEFNKQMDSKGALINASTSNEATRFYFSSLRETFFDCLELYANLIKAFTLTDEVLKKEKGVVLNEIGVSKDNNNSVIYQLLCSGCFKQHPIKHPILGYDSTVEALSVETVQNYYNKHYTASNMTVIVVGDFSEADIDRIAGIIETFENRERVDHKEITLAQAEPTQLFASQYKKDLTQSLIYSALTIPGSENRDTLSILSTILGGSMSSFLWKEFREDRNIAYMISASCYTFDKNTNSLLFYTGLNDKDNVTLAIDLFKKAILYSKDITEEELQKGKLLLKTQIVGLFEKSSSIADLVEDELYFNPEHVDLNRRLSNIENLTYDVFKTFVSTLRPDTLASAVLLPKEDTSDE